MSDPQSQALESTRTTEWEAKADRLYRYIHDNLKKHAKAPSQREMAAAMGCSRETIVHLLNHLESSGRGLHRIRRCARRLWVPINEMPEEER